MTGICSTRWLAVEALTRTASLGLLASLFLPLTLHAQQWPNYPQPAAPYGHYPVQGYQQPVQRAQNVYYGNYQNNSIPGYIYPRNHYPTPSNYQNGNGGGVTYYYVPNPNGSHYHPYGPAYGTPGSFQGAPVSMPAAQTWPIPARTPTLAPHTPITEDPNDDGRKPTVAFHRNTNEHWWFKADYLASFIRPIRLGSGPLVTNGSILDGLPGTLGQPGTTVAFGNDPIDFGLASGFRLEAGKFLDADNCYSTDIGGFMLFPTAQTFVRQSDANGNPVLARPVNNVNAQTPPGAFLNSLPGAIAARLSIETISEMAGIELNARYHTYLRERVHLEGLVGIRYLRLAERMSIQEQLNPLQPTFVFFQGAFVTNPNILTDEDTFRTFNNFIGPQIGGRVSWEHKWFTLDAHAKLGIGAAIQQSNISGSTSLVTPTGKQTVPGGILALPSNSGNHSRTILGIVPEFGFNVGVDLTQCVRLNLGYNFLIWNRVVRPGSQYDININPNQAPGSPTFGLGGTPAPGFRFNDEFFWTHMLNVGLEYHF